MTQCLKCNTWIYGITHKCPPEWLWREKCNDSDLETEWTDCPSVWAYDEEEAAIKAAELWDLDDYHLVKGNTVTLSILDPRTAEVFDFLVGGEAIPSYYARKV